MSTTEDITAPDPAIAPMRQRHRPTYFMWHGDRWAFHRLEDGSTLGRLDPYCAHAQRWPLLSGRVIHVTGAEVRDITKQVHDLDLPDTRPEGGGYDPALYERVQALEGRVAALEAARQPDAPQAQPEPVIQYRDTPETLAERDDLRRRLEEAEAKLAPPQDRTVPEERPQQLPPDPESAKLVDYGPVGSSVPPEIRELMEGSETLSEAIDRLTPGLDELLDLASALSDDALDTVLSSIEASKRRKWTEMLHGEKADLRTKRDTNEENLPREKQIDRLLNLFARVGAKR